MVIMHSICLFNDNLIRLSSIIIQFVCQTIPLSVCQVGCRHSIQNTSEQDEASIQSAAFIINLSQNKLQIGLNRSPGFAFRRVLYFDGYGMYMYVYMICELLSYPWI